MKATLRLSRLCPLSPTTRPPQLPHEGGYSQKIWVGCAALFLSSEWRLRQLGATFVAGLIQNDENVASSKSHIKLHLIQDQSEKATPFLRPKWPKSIPYFWTKELENHYPLVPNRPSLPIVGRITLCSLGCWLAAACIIRLFLPARSRVCALCAVACVFFLFPLIWPK